MNQAKPVPVIFGEVLFDIFPGGSRVLGGAPFNVAWHLRGFGLKPLMISAVGKDDLGREILDRMTAWNMDTAGIQVDPEHPTGIVQVSLDHGEPSYDVVRDRAWDFIQPGPALEATGSGGVAMLYHGSLAARNQGTALSLETLKQKRKTPVFVDVNLRPPYWDRGLIDSLLTGASWIKLNQSELDLLADPSPGDLAAGFLKARGAEWIITTRGEQGASLTSAGFGTLEQEPPLVNKLVDTVGAGDAFSSLVIYGLMKGWSPAVILKRAVEFAADICAIQGATTNDRDIYRKRMEEWKLENP